MYNEQSPRNFPRALFCCSVCLRISRIFAFSCTRRTGVAIFRKPTYCRKHQMKKFQALLLVVSALTAFSCKKNAPETFLEGSKWKLLGFYESGSQNVDAPKPENCRECYVILFETGGNWTGHSSANRLYGQYTVNKKETKLKLSNIGGTEVNELYDGPRFMLMLTSVSLFELKDNKLKLFNGTEDYLLFERIP